MKKLNRLDKQLDKCSICEGKGVIHQFGKLMRCIGCNGTGFKAKD